MFDIDGLVDEGEHAVVEDDRDAIVEERLAKDKEVEAGVHLVILILSLLIPYKNTVAGFLKKI